MARIREGYRAHLLLDNLPVGTRRPRDGAAPLLERGYLLGAAAPDGAIVHNHLHFTVRYHLPSPSVTTGEAWRGSGRRARIVGFEVEPSSRGYTHAEAHTPCFVRLGFVQFSSVLFSSLLFSSVRFYSVLLVPSVGRSVAGR